MNSISKLPKYYRELAEKRRNKTNTDNLRSAFTWNHTPEGFVWWNKVFEALKIKDLPPIPEQSKKEIMKDTFEFKFGHDILIKHPNQEKKGRAKYLHTDSGDGMHRVMADDSSGVPIVFWTSEIELDLDGQPITGDKVEFSDNYASWVKGIYGHKGTSVHFSQTGTQWRHVRYPKQEEKVELSVAEIAERLDIPVKQLKIVDK